MKLMQTKTFVREEPNVKNKSKNECLAHEY